MLAVRLRRGQRIAQIGYIGDALAADIEDNVAGFQPVFGARAVRIHRRDHDALAAGARDLIRRRNRQAEMRQAGN